jgi:hypothetical protein
MEKYPNGTSMPNLATQVTTLDWLPTPQARDYRSPKRVNSQSSYLMLNETIHKAELSGLIPTPAAAEGTKITGNENQDSLTKRVRQQTGKTGQLNPLFVLEMMGFPSNWTLLPFLITRVSPRMLKPFPRGETSP